VHQNERKGSPVVPVPVPVPVSRSGEDSTVRSTPPTPLSSGRVIYIAVELVSFVDSNPERNGMEWEFGMGERYSFAVERRNTKRSELLKMDSLSYPIPTTHRVLGGIDGVNLCYMEQNVGLFRRDDWFD
jgi:hypothetical protein